MTKKPKTQHDIPLSDVMLAMDIADTIRHRERVVEKELSAEEREKALFEKVKATYASQGIEVSDATIQEAIEAIEDERFAYKPPKASLFTKFAHAYINRKKWGKGLAFIGGIVGLAWAATWAIFTLPQQRELDEKAQAFNQSIVTANTNEETLQSRLDSLVAELNRATKPKDPQLTALFDRQKQTAFQLLKTSATHIDAARTLRLAPNFVPLNFKEIDPKMSGSLQILERQQQELSKAENKLNEAEVSIKQLHQLNLLPNELLNLRNQAIEIAKVAKAESLAEEFYRKGLAAIQGLDIASANGATTDLKELIDDLQLNYELRIVYRHGERTGVWRQPEINRNARNYYIIVEAYSKDNRTIQVPIINEETGNIQRVSKWGLRVDKSIYDQIASDKQDDGIVQNNIFGNKAYGELTVNYRFPTSGKAITRW